MKPSKILEIPENFAAQGGQVDRHLDAIHWGLFGLSAWATVTAVLASITILGVFIWMIARTIKRASATPNC